MECISRCHYEIDEGNRKERSMPSADELEEMVLG